MSNMSKLRNKFIAVLAVLLCAMLCLSTAFLIPKTKTASAARNTVNFNIIGSSSNDLYLEKAINGKVFNGNLLDELYKEITGIDGATIGDISNLVSGGDFTSADIRKNSTNGKNVSVWFGGIKWDIVYITKDKSGDNIVLDLWQSADGANSKQGTPTSGTYLTSTEFAKHSVNESNVSYPSSMYSTSKIRSDKTNGLNAGGYISTSNSVIPSIKESQSENNKYARFTMQSVTGSLTKYIVTPENVEYQKGEYSQTGTSGSGSDVATLFNCPNDAWDEPTHGSYYKSTSASGIDLDFTDKENYGDWKEDYLWLPSISETGRGSSGVSGIWKADNNLRASGTSTSSESSWLRSGNRGTASGNYCLTHSGELDQFDSTVSLIVRPALHLNMSKAEEDSIRLLTVEDVSNVYNGDVQTLNSLTNKPSWYNEDLYNSSTIDVEYVGNMTDVGEYTVRVTIADTDNYWWADGNTSSASRTFKYKITKAPLNMQTLKVDENGNLQGEGSVNDLIKGTYLSTNIFPRDVGKSSEPQFGLQYKRTNGGSWSPTLPEVAGEYYVRAYIINANTSYYYLASDGQTTFTKPKEYVETPHFTKDGIDSTAIVGSTTTVQYSGDYQEFKLVNTPDDKLVGVTVGAREGGLSYDQKTGTFRAKAVGIYTVEVLLEDGGANTQWDSSATEISRTITLIITKADLEVNILESDMTSWTKGEIDYLTVQVSGVKNGENVKLDVYYQVKGSANKTYVADSAMILDEESGIITVTVNLATFDSNKQYQLYVSLRDNISANDNYTLINNSAPYEFFIMTATINDEEVKGAWKISNLIYGTKEAIDGIEVDYNGLEYTLTLDESKLIKGLEATYSNESFKDADSYTTTVLLTCQAGYQLASGKSSISFEISWKINPIEYDVADLIWASNPEYSGSYQTMSIINLPAWLTDDYVSISGNEERLVNTYTAIYILYSDGNYTFVYSGSDSENNAIEPGGQMATLKHVWAITKKIINVTNAPKQWTTEQVEYSADDTYYYYNIYVPNIPEGIDSAAIKVTYYNSADFTDENKVADIRQLTVDYEIGATYYIKIEIADAYKNIYEMYNTLTKEEYAYTSFKVGGNIEIIEVDYDSDDELMYNGETRDITATYRDVKFKYTYYKLTDSGEEQLSGAPKEVGSYKLVVAPDGDDANYYWIQNSVFYFTITPLVLTTNGYKPAKGNELKESYVISDAVEDTSPYFEYQIFNKNNQRVYEPLEYNTTYTVKLVILNEHKEHAVWADDAVTTYIFTTSYDPSAGTQYFDDPTITVTDKDGKTVDTDSVVWTSDDFTVTINNWDSLSPFVTVTIDGEEDNNGSYIFTNVGIYTITITINETALQYGVAGWLWDSGSASKTLTFEIIKRYVGIPTANGEVGYTGEEQYLFPNGYEEDYINLSDGAIISATEIGGEWVVTLSLRDKVNSCWADGTTDDKTFTWSIVEAKPAPDDPDANLEEKKDDRKAELEEAARKKREEIENNPDLTEEEKKELKDKVDEELQKGLEAIDSATSSSELDSAFNEAKKNIEDIGLKKDSSPFPWWILAVIGAALLLLILLIIIIIKRRQVVDDDEYDDYYDDEYDYEEEYEEDGDFGDDF